MKDCKSDCIFCKIVAKEIPAQVAYEDPGVVAFHDINPQAPVHIQIIPKQHIARVSELTTQTLPIVGKLMQVANQLAGEFKISEPGYRLVINCNAGAGQSVFHLHLHLLGGRPMRWPPG